MQYYDMERKMEEKLNVEFHNLVHNLLGLLSSLQDDSSAKLQSLMLRLNYNEFFAPME